MKIKNETVVTRIEVYKRVANRRLFLPSSDLLHHRHFPIANSSDFTDNEMMESKEEVVGNEKV
ncbi:hypothetical protein ACX12E_27475 [Paenibacillus vandeheii]